MFVERRSKLVALRAALILAEIGHNVLTGSKVVATAFVLAASNLSVEYQTRNEKILRFSLDIHLLHLSSCLDLHDEIVPQWILS